MLSHCENCQFYTWQKSIYDLGCAVNPYYWEFWKHLQSLPAERVAQYPICKCPDYEAVPQVPLSETLNNTLWQVACASKPHHYHRIPWEIFTDGTMRVGTIWQGVWEVISPETRLVSMTVRLYYGAIDHLSVVFHPQGLAFKALKDGNEYWVGKRLHVYKPQYGIEKNTSQPNLTFNELNSKAS